MDLLGGTCSHGRDRDERCPFCHPLPSTLQTRGEAELAIKPSAANLREQVLATIKAHPGGITDEQIAKFSGLNPNTARPRRLELEKAGRIVASGTAKTHSGRKAVTWVAAS
jgi:hypothetical protein